MKKKNKIKVAVQMDKLSKINKAAQRLEQEFERSPREDELAKQLDMNSMFLWSLMEMIS